MNGGKLQKFSGDGKFITFLVDSGGDVGVELSVIGRGREEVYYDRDDC